MVVIATIALWEVFCTLYEISELILPKPSAIAIVFVDRFSLMMSNFGVTAVESTTGLGLGILVGVVIAFIMVYVPAVERAIYPLLVISQAVPKIAVAPLFIVWFGYGLGSKVLVAFLVCFFPIVIDTLAGLKSVDRDRLMLARSMKAREWSILTHIRVPSALPHFFSGLKVAVTLAVIGAVVGEFMGSSAGLGSMILSAQSFVNMPEMFAAIGMLSILGIILFYAVVAIERLVIPWHSSIRDNRE